MINQHVLDLKNKGYTILKLSDCMYQKLLKQELDYQITHKINLKQYNQHIATINQPLLHCKNVLPLYLNQMVFDIIQSYYGCQPVILSSNLKKSFITKLPPEGTTIFHRDRESLVLLKVFFYLNDVDIDSGPFTYVSGSFNKKRTKEIPGYDRKKHFTDREIMEMFGKENIKPLTTACGNIIIADTTGFHKGMQYVKHPRYMLTATFNPSPQHFNQQHKYIKKILMH